MAAVLACGEGGFLTGRAAGFLLVLIRAQRAPDPEVIARTARQIDGIAVSRARKMDPRDVTTWKGIPVTTPARTLVDLAAVVSAEELSRAVHQADVLHGATPDDVETVLRRRPNAKGAAKLRKVLWGDADRILSWPKHKLTVELDSYRYHRSRHAWELDRKRERQAYARGDQFRRYTWGDVVEHPRPTLKELRAVLASV
jgi:hypothetical protein